MTGWLLAAGALLAARHLFLLWWHPFGPCLLCGGSGTNRGSNRRRFGMCPLCKGSKRRRRLGAVTMARLTGRKLP